ncbi:MAG: glycoside hydrolase family 57 protein [Planctomycetota bacterium]|nr:glycoside hydrolase family 57 protein [Planctomycetota bacterium]
MTEPIHLAFLWHQHQPFYKDTLSDRIEMPWVRLHAIKDYYGMAAMIERHPGIKATVNFVPSLLVQLQDQIDGKQDIWQSLSRIAPSDMNYDQRRFLLQNFFMTNPNTMIRPLPRYFELYGRRSGVDIDEKVVARFSDEEIRDIQALSNLAWFHPITLEDDVFLGETYKCQHFSEEEKQQILDKQIEVMKQVIPLHRKLQDEGRLELSTTPFYHPIIPLLLDEHSVHEAMPDARLPRRTLPLAGDAYEQVRRAYQYHTEVFGKAPAGMWPSEGSVSQEAAELFASAGAKWIATDEEILARSTGVQKSAQRHPYRPYRVNGVPGSLSIVFRDHVVSDLMSFQYQYFNEDDAVSDFLEKIRDIGKRHSERPLCVFVILDGENAWEHYRRTAYPFFVKLYEKLEEADDIVLTRISEYIENHEPTHSIDRVAAGSWINGDFAIWAGHDEDIEAWEYIDRVREDLRIMTQSSHGKYNSADVKNAWEEIYIAEGSDYFWWYGEDHSSVQDMEFDALFRMHLKNVYRHLGEGYPEFLDEPIKKRGQRKLYSEPTAPLQRAHARVSSYSTAFRRSLRFQCRLRLDGTRVEHAASGRLLRFRRQQPSFAC